MENVELMLILFFMGFAGGFIIALAQGQYQRKRRREQREQFLKKKQQSEKTMYEITQAMNKFGRSINKFGRSINEAAKGITVYKAGSDKMSEEEFSENLKRDCHAK